jgi:hypothetical protein
MIPLERAFVRRTLVALRRDVEARYLDAGLPVVAHVEEDVKGGDVLFLGPGERPERLPEPQARAASASP